MVLCGGGQSARYASARARERVRGGHGWRCVCSRVVGGLAGPCRAAPRFSSERAIASERATLEAARAISPAPATASASAAARTSSAHPSGSRGHVLRRRGPALFSDPLHRVRRRKRRSVGGHDSYCARRAETGRRKPARVWRAGSGNELSTESFIVARSSRRRPIAGRRGAHVESSCAWA
jgi:hypothetical protein